MATTITLKNIPAGLYAKLKASARTNGRSLNREALMCLQLALNRQPAVDVQLEMVKRLRTQLKGLWVTDEEISRAKREGRE